MTHNRFFERDMRRGVAGSGRDRSMDGHEKFSRFKGFLERQEDYARNSNDMRRMDYAPYYPQHSQMDYTPMHHDMMGNRDYRGGDMRRNDYNYGYDSRMDYGNNYSYDGHEKITEEQYYKDLERWAEKLKKKDRFKMRKEDVLAQAKQMGIKFEEFSEMEFYVVYLMMISDYKNVANDHRMYLSMAKDWLEDDDIEVSPSEKLCIYYYDIVKGKGVE